MVLKILALIASVSGLALTIGAATQDWHWANASVAWNLAATFLWLREV